VIVNKWITKIDNILLGQLSQIRIWVFQLDLRRVPQQPAQQHKKVLNKPLSVAFCSIKISKRLANIMFEIKYFGTITTR